MHDVRNGGLLQRRQLLLPLGLALFEAEALDLERVQAPKYEQYT